jgi:hypothetical protein
MYKNEKLRLDFDCEKCEMQVIVWMKFRCIFFDLYD